MADRLPSIGAPLRGGSASRAAAARGREAADTGVRHRPGPAAPRPRGDQGDGAPFDGPAAPDLAGRRAAAVTAVTAAGPCTGLLAAAHSPTPAVAGVGTTVAAVIVFGGAAALMVVLAVASRGAGRRERALLRELSAYAMECGWRTVPATSPLPAPVARAARSRNTRLVLAADAGGAATWLVWHHWVQSTGQISAVRDLTRCFVRLGPAVPDAVVRRRTRLGTLVRPVRGVGTGDPAFDHRFLVRGHDGDAVRRLLTPELRREMLAGRLPPWSIHEGMLIVRHQSPPRANNLRPWAAAAARFARLLTAR